MKNLPATNFQLLSPEEFLDDVKLETRDIKYRLWAQSMDVTPGPLTNELLTTLEKKSIEGIDTKLHIDYYSLLVSGGSFNYLTPFLKSVRQNENHKILAKKIYFDRLEKNGVKLLFTNPPRLLEKLFPFKGRNHMKIVIADNSAWIGGVNFNDWNLTGNDFMVKLTDPKIVSHIATLYKKIDREEDFDDYKISATEETTLLVDSGKRDKSIILDTALELIENAENSVLMSSAFFPDTKVVRDLHALHLKGEEVKVVAPTPRSMSGLYKYVEKINYEIMRLRNLKFPAKMLTTTHHAKLLVVDRKIAMFGSHNFSGRGVALGTGEIAIMSTNKEIIENLLDFFDKTYQKD